MHNLPAWAEMIVIFSHFFLFLRTKSGCGALGPENVAKHFHGVGMSLAKLLNVIILILFTIGAALLLVLEITTVRQSILDQMCQP
jgi:hypothetical protein